jgi:HEAT repeat protein
MARLLGEIGDPASSACLEPLLACEDEDLLHDVIAAIGKIGVSGPEATLAEILANPEAHFTVRVQAASALGRLLRGGTPAGQEANTAWTDLRAFLARAVFDPHDAVCQSALQALVDVDAQNAVATLSEILRAARPADETLGNGASNHDTGTAQQQEGAEELQRLAAGHDATTSTLAAMVTAAAEEEPAAVEAAGDELQEQPRNAVRVLAVRLLGGLAAPGTQAVRELIDACAQADLELRREIIVALGRIGDREALPVIVEALAAAEEEIRSVALDALGCFPGMSAADEHLLGLLADENAFIRERAVQAIGAMRSPAALAALPRMLDDSDRLVCRAALRALPADMKSEELSTRIVGLMFKFSAELTADAAAALRTMSDWGSAKRLLAILNDPTQEEFHWICIDALAEMFAREPGVVS